MRNIRVRFSVLPCFLAAMVGGCEKPEAGPKFTEEELRQYLEKQDVDDQWTRLQRQIDRENALLEQSK